MHELADRWGSIRLVYSPCCPEARSAAPFHKHATMAYAGIRSVGGPVAVPHSPDDLLAGHESLVSRVAGYQPVVAKDVVGVVRDLHGIEAAGQQDLGHLRA